MFSSVGISGIRGDVGFLNIDLVVKVVDNNNYEFNLYIFYRVCYLNYKSDFIVLIEVCF